MEHLPTTRILKGVSRSFYLSLRLLPEEMREGASLAYLLARASDTVADCGVLPAAARISALDGFGRCVAGDASWSAWPAGLVDDGCARAERELLDHAADLIRRLDALDGDERELIRSVVGTIVSGQRLDLERFNAAHAGGPVVIGDELALDDYTWRVAGCVGEFWTRLGGLTLGNRFSAVPVEALLERAVAYGKGLQLVNILRDLPADLDEGRCYLPVDDPLDREQLLAMHRRYVVRARSWVQQGLEYSRMLAGRRVRVASVLPALIAVETLDRLQHAGWEDLVRGVKVSRVDVYRSVVEAMFH